MVGRRYIRYIHTESHHVDFLTGVLTFRTALNTRYLFLLLFFTDARWHINRFILQLGLTKDINEFMDKVRNSPLAGNVDSPESGKSYNLAGCRYLKSEEVFLLAGLDALMQVISCEQDIGWRSDVRRIVFVITDQEPHYAFDGQLAGKNRCQVSKTLTSL